MWRGFSPTTSSAGSRLRAISARDITAWYTRLQEQTGKTMTARVYGFVSSVFNAAVRDRLVDHNPCTIRGASEAPRRSKKTVATPEQIAEALLHLDERYRAMILLAAWSGLRSGEFRNLRRRNVDLVGRRVVVEEQVQNLRGQGKVVRGVKTEAGARIVHLPASVTKVLEAHMGAFSQAGPEGLVFPSRVGTPPHRGGQTTCGSYPPGWSSGGRKPGRPVEEPCRTSRCRCPLLSAGEAPPPRRRNC